MQTGAGLSILLVVYADWQFSDILARWRLEPAVQGNLDQKNRRKMFHNLKANIKGLRSHQNLLNQRSVFRLYPGIAPGWVYYFRPTIAAKSH